MQVLIEVPDEKASFVMELLKNLSFVEIKDDHFLHPSEAALQTPRSLSPKTASLLGAFPVLGNDSFKAREDAIVRKHL